MRWNCGKMTGVQLAIVQKQPSSQRERVSFVLFDRMGIDRLYFIEKKKDWQPQKDHD
jgi:hypothetical protein